MADDSADIDTADLLGLSDFSHSSREANESAALLQQPKWQPSRKTSSSRSGRGGEKLYQGRTSAQKQQPASKSPPLAQKPKLKTKSSRSKRESELRRPKRLSKSNASDEPKHSQAEVKRPKRLSQSTLSCSRKRSISSGSISSDDMLEVLNDGPFAKQQLQRRRSRSASPITKKPPPRRPSLQRRPSSVHSRSSIQRRPSMQRRPSIQRRPSFQNKRPQLTRRISVHETSSRSILAGSLQDNDAIFPRRNSISTLHVPLKDEPRPGRGRSRNNEDGYVRRRSRSLDANTFGHTRNDLIPVEHAPMNDKPRNRRRSVSWDSAEEHSNYDPTDFREELEKRRASSKKAEADKRDSNEVKEDLEKRKAVLKMKTGVESRTRNSMPAMHPTKKDEKKQQRHSMPVTMKNNRTDPNSQEDNRRIEPSAEEFQAGESSPRRRINRRGRAAAGVSRLHSSFNKSLTQKLRIRKSPLEQPTAAAAAAAAGVSSREAAEEIDMENSRRKKKRGCYISRFMMTVMCFCYLFSLVGVFAVGFWAHMEFFAYKDTDTNMNKNVGVSQGTYENSPESLGASDATSMLRPPSSSSSSSGPTSSAKFQPLPTDGGLGTKVSQIPAVASNNPSSAPTPIVSDSPSSTPTSSSHPTSTPSISPSKLASESPSSEPTATRSESPSSSPSILDECPETLSRSMPFISDTSLTLYYETVIYQDHPTGGLLCASLEYSGAAGWIGIAFSTAGRNPQFGRREAIIGMPGIDTSIAVSAENVTSSALNPSGSQNNFVEGGPYFVNPGKYEIPAGGLDGYYGPSLGFLMSASQQTLVNASVITSDDSNQTVTRLLFAKYLREPGEIEINPMSGPTLILYAVAPIDTSSGLYINENPQWKYINMILGGGRSNTRSSLMRKRQHNE